MSPLIPLPPRTRKKMRTSDLVTLLFFFFCKGENLWYRSYLTKFSKFSLWYLSSKQWWNRILHYSDQKTEIRFVFSIPEKLYAPILMRFGVVEIFSKFLCMRFPIWETVCERIIKILSRNTFFYSFFYRLTTKVHRGKPNSYSFIT